MTKTIEAWRLMARLSQTNPELFANPTLGEANPTRFLDEEEKQAIEDRAARLDKREPNIARREIRYPTWAPAQAVPSSVQPVVNMLDPDTNAVVVEGPGKVPTPVMSDENPPVVDYSPSVAESDITDGLTYDDES